MSNQNPFEKIKKQANLSPNEIYKVADSVKHADFSDERTVRQLIRQLAQMANKPISKDKEDQIVSMITSNNMPMDMQSLNKLFKK
ncbi:stage VI sporulation protein F [Virgibacillus soli]|uniref:Stage VI sporulation protein F n=1 Tax=Paracerasibacillus soli TaxID=480284 RepID=A0ABU5CPR0_9BACI|nr:stage VI sporulation protein F [Virgibacillus soli]MDY0408324.1 stage VI sporulation protein F [Virgibacillus soli]